MRHCGRPNRCIGQSLATSDQCMGLLALEIFCNYGRWMGGRNSHPKIFRIRPYEAPNCIPGSSETDTCHFLSCDSMATSTV